VLLDDVYDQAGIVIDQGDKMVNAVNDGFHDDPPVEALGIEISAATETMTYPPAKIPRLQEMIDALVAAAETGTVSVGQIESTLGKEKWAAHVAIEINPLLASSHATVVGLLKMRAHSSNGSGRGGHKGGRSASSGPPAKSLAADQRAVRLLTLSMPSVPLVPASFFPPAAAPGCIHPFQDACETYGIGGFFHDVTAGCFRYYIMKWPVWVGEALRARPRRWTIAAGELFAELVAVDAVVRLTDMLYITDYTDNEVARATANRGSTTLASLEPLVVALQSVVISAGRHLRTVRVSTKENSISDALSRADVAPMLALADEAGIPAVPFPVPPWMWSLLGPLDTPISPDP
jgi:hypothetical protein